MRLLSIVLFAFVCCVCWMSSTTLASPSPSTLMSWSVTDVTSWLRENGLPQLEAVFEEEAIDGEALLELDLKDDETLRQLSINSSALKRKFLKLVDQLVTAYKTPATKTTSKTATAAAATAKPTDKKEDTKPKLKDDEEEVTLPDGTKRISKKGTIREGLDLTKIPAGKPLSPKEEMEVEMHYKEGQRLYFAGKYDGAKETLKKALKLAPRHAKSIQLIGLCVLQLTPEQKEKAMTLIKTAVALEPDAENTLNLANLLMELARPTEAIHYWERSLTHNPILGGPPLRLRIAQAWYVEANRLYKDRRFAETKQVLSKILFHVSEALLQHFPANYVPHMSQDMIQDLIRLREVPVPEGQSHPRNSSAYNNLFNSHLRSAPVDLMKANAELTHQLRALYIEAFIRFAQIEKDANRVQLAIATLERALTTVADPLDQVKPKNEQIKSFRDLGEVLLSQLSEIVVANKLDISAKFKADLDQARLAAPYIAIDPENLAVSKSVAEHLHGKCLTREAADLNKVLNPLTEIFDFSTRLPFLVESDDEIELIRRNYDAGMKSVLKNAEALQAVMTQSLQWDFFRFFLAYHGKSNRALLENVAKTNLLLNPKLKYTASHLLPPSAASASSNPSFLQLLAKRMRKDRGISANEAKIRVGFLSSWLFSHPVGKLVQGYIEKLNRKKFTIFTYSLTANPKKEEENFKAKDPIHKHIYEKSDIYREVLKGDIPSIRQAVEKDKLDILIFPCIGMDQGTYYVAFSRLAPIQVAMYGHPDTSGLPFTVDYFLLQKGMLPAPEEKSAEKLFSEKNVHLLKGVGYWIPPPPVSTLSTRADFGLSLEQLKEAGVVLPGESAQTTPTFYLVGKSPQFYSPAFQSALAEILHRNPNSFLAIINNSPSLSGTGQVQGVYDTYNACIETIIHSIESRMRVLQLEELKSNSQDEQQIHVFDVLTKADAVRARQRKDARWGTAQTEANFVLNSTQVDAVSSLVSQPAEFAPPSPSTGRIRVLPYLHHERFTSILALADVILQPFPLDGMTLTMEALQMNTPLVTIESQTPGGRMASTILKHIHLDELVASTPAEYIQKAVQLGQDEKQRKTIQEKIKQNQQTHRLWKDEAAIDEFTSFLESAIERKLKEVR